MNVSKMSLFRISKIALPLALVAGLSACAPSFKADVSRFQSQLPAPPGQTFAVVAEDPGLVGGLEFAFYADMVGDKMERLGYIEAPSPETATLLVRFDYGVDGGRERVRTNNIGIGGAGFGPGGGLGGFGGGFGGFGFQRNFGFGFNDPFFGGPDVRSFTIFNSNIDLKIDNAVTGQRLFEGQAQAVSRSNRLQELVPNLVDAIFTNFPGNSGETLLITIREDDNKVQVRD
jgi:hypothetical protein